VRAAATLLVLVVLLGLAIPAAGSAASTYTATLDGAEIPPITSTVGTFVGVANSPLRATWRVQIKHEPLRTGATVAITGGSYSFATLSRNLIRGRVLGGSVTVTNRGNHCTNQTYRVTVELEDGSFDGTLTHRRHSLLGQCLIYAATIRGQATLTKS